VLRGVAALAVVFWHWQHFFFHGTQRGTLAVEELPLYGVFAPLYTHGWLGVDLFFCLSGFVFYWLYSGAVAARAISGRDFFVLRFSRLYPLHAATLLIVAAGQGLAQLFTGSPFVYRHNDAYHFVLNVFFAPAWGLEEGPSFNAPAWSVSVEVVLYALFFGLCRALPVRAPLLLGAAGIGLVVVGPLYLPLGRGICAFFIGGFACLAYQRIVEAGRVRAVLRWLPWLGAAAWLLIPLATSSLPARAQHLYVAALVFPLTILTLALLETQRGTLLRSAAFLGDMSYSSYLLHFPLQLLAVGAAAALGANRSVFYSAWTLAAFIAVLLAVSFASHRFLEMPAQRALRRRALTRAQDRFVHARS
jgi:peptidoglycan/LPS O-acetylase OafA/YrhL